jgi:hypothetical protein
LRWLEINTGLPTSKDLPSSLVQLRSAVRAFSPDGRTALFGSGDYTLKLWDLTAR